MSQQCLHLCRNVAFSFRHKWKESLKLAESNQFKAEIKSRTGLTRNAEDM